VVDELHEGVVIAEPTLKPKIGPDIFIWDHDTTVCVAAMAENVGGSLSNRTG
jgi:hypothetical protein